MSSKAEIIEQLTAAVTNGRTDILRSIISAVEKGTCGSVRISSDVVRLCQDTIPNILPFFKMLFMKTVIDISYGLYFSENG